jgi:CheY-like chemotaxis protein
MLDKREDEEEHEVRDVLLVEDSLIDAQLIRRLLRRVTSSYYRVTHVRTLNDAVLSAEDVVPDVILADLTRGRTRRSRFDRSRRARRTIWSKATSTARTCTE